MTPAPISVERLRELLDKATPGPWTVGGITDANGGDWTVVAGRLVVASVHNGASFFDVLQCREPRAQSANCNLIAETITALPALLHQLAEMSADLEREQGVREDAQRQLRAAERAREEACGLLRDIRPVLSCADTYGACGDLRDRIAAFLAASGGKVDG